MAEHHFHVRLDALYDLDGLEDLEDLDDRDDLEASSGDTAGGRSDGVLEGSLTPEAHSRPARPGAIARRHRIVAEGKPDIVGSSAKVFHGESSRWNPEELLIAALAQCHFLSFVYLAGAAGIEIRAFNIEATGTLEWDSAGKGQMTRVELRPFVSVPGGHRDQAQALHPAAHDACFIARSVNFEVAVIAQTISLV